MNLNKKARNKVSVENKKRKFIAIYGYVFVLGQIGLVQSTPCQKMRWAVQLGSLAACTHRERLSLLNLDTLEYRRLSCDLTLCYKIFNNLTLWSPREYFNDKVPPYGLHFRFTSV